MFYSMVLKKGKLTKRSHALSSTLIDIKIKNKNLKRKTSNSITQLSFIFLRMSFIANFESCQTNHTCEGNLRA